MFGPTAQAVQLGRGGVQGQRLLPHRQPGGWQVVEGRRGVAEFGKSWFLDVIGAGEVIGRRQFLRIVNLGRTDQFGTRDDLQLGVIHNLTSDCKSGR